ncbi:MAG: hypothetical protein VKK07_07255, partial [Merismopediaceae bacterium]|nr:hypothetical protein [Merismopediaceae bacterium]
LMIGRCTVGEGACIGQTSTLIDTSIDPFSLIPSGTLLGDRSRSEETLPQPTQTETEPIPSPWDSETPSPIASPSVTSEQSLATTEDNPNPVAEPEPASPTPTEEVLETVNPVEWAATSETVNKSPEPVIGQVYINQLLVTLFPERQSLQRSSLS